MLRKTFVKLKDFFFWHKNFKSKIFWAIGTILHGLNFAIFFALVWQKDISSSCQSRMILPSIHWLLWHWIFFHRGLIWIQIKVQKSESANVLSLIFSLIFKSLSVLRVCNSISEQTIKSNSSGQFGQLNLHGLNFVIFLLFCQPSTT